MRGDHVVYAVPAPFDRAILVTALDRRHAGHRQPDAEAFPDHQYLGLGGAVEQVAIRRSDSQQRPDGIVERRHCDYGRAIRRRQAAQAITSARESNHITETARYSVTR